jgi:hypothetical protein
MEPIENKNLSNPQLKKLNFPIINGMKTKTLRVLFYSRKIDTTNTLYRNHRQMLI